MNLAKHREFLLRERWFSLKDKVDVMDPATQEPVGYFQRKLFSIPMLYRLYDVSGENELIVQQRLWSFPSAYRFFSGNSSGEPDEAALFGQLRRTLFPFVPHYWFEATDSTRQFELRGDFIGLNYEINRDGRAIGSVSRKFWAIRDTYGLRIDAAVPDRMALLLLGSVIVIHAIHERRRRSRA
ncbi:MAG TPA: hypothetical protein VMH22_12290 [bacterium]|nr:hypothetical protein [bacterium]